MNSHNNVDVCIASSSSNRTLTSAESIHYNTTPVKMENPFERINMELIEIKSMLKILLDREVKVTEKSDLINLKEACQILNLSSSSVYKLTAKNAIPTIKREGAKKLMFSRAELNNWIKDSQAPSLVYVVNHHLQKNLRVRKAQNN
jgi:excisionase family DNA binding protein